MKKIFGFVLAVSVAVSTIITSFAERDFYEYYYGDIDEYQGKSYRDILIEKIQDLVYVYDEATDTYSRIKEKFSEKLVDENEEEITIDSNTYYNIDGNFKELPNLKKIYMTDGMLSISDLTFQQSNIEEIEFADSIMWIGVDAFGFCKNLKEAYLPESLQVLELNTFQECSALETVDLGGVKHIGDSVFLRCTSLKNIDLSNVVYISDHAFQGCESLESIDLSNVEYIGDWAFEGCKFLKEVYVPETVQFIDIYAFDDIDTTIICEQGSYAEQWAIENNYNYILNGVEPTPVPTAEPTVEPTPEPTVAPTPSPTGVVENKRAVLYNEYFILSVTNYDETPENPITVVAKYNADGNMIACKTFENNHYTTGVVQEIDVVCTRDKGEIAELPENGEYIKVMIWEKDTLKPLCNTWIIDENTVWEAY